MSRTHPLGRSATHAVFLTCLFAGLLINALAIFFIFSSRPIVGTFEPRAIQALGKNLYAAPLNLQADWPYQIVTDSSEAPYGSDFLLLENNRKLGPPHTLHADIASVGAGAYSYWYNTILFAASDNSDPRENGRRYSFVAGRTLIRTVQISLFAALLIADLVIAFLFRAELKERLPVYRKSARSAAWRVAVFVAPWMSWIAIAVGSLALVLTLIAANGSFGSITLANAGSPKDAALTFAIVRHVVLGCVTSIGLWAAAAGLLRLLPSFRSATVAQLLLPAFPLILPLTAALAAFSLAMPWGRPIAFVLWMACLAPLSRWRPPIGELAALLTAAVVILPLAMVFGMWLGLLWHGPTDTLSGAPSGDVSFYAGSIWTLAVHPYPNINLGYENGAATTYFNQLYPALGAALLPLPGFDPFLFILCSGGTSYVLFTCLSLHIFLAERRAHAIGVLDLAIVFMAMIVAARYPYWVVESIPVVFAPALTVSIWWMTDRGKSTAGWSVAAISTAFLGTALSKVTSAVTLVPLAAGHVAFRVLHGSIRLRLALYVVGFAFAAYSALMAARFLPQILAAGTPGPESLQNPLWYFTFRDFSALVLIALAWLMAAPPLAASLTLGLIGFLAYAFITQINFVVAVVTFGLMAASATIPSSKMKYGLLGALGLALPAMIFGEPAGMSSAVVWIVCIGGGVCAAIAAARVAPGLTLRLHHAAFSAAFTLALAMLVLSGVARGTIIADSGWHRAQRDLLTPEVKQVWSAVRELTPPDALIFTDQVDDTINLLGGWNTFALSGQRNVFVSSYYTTAELRSDALTRDKVFAVNELVLAGRSSPRDVVTQFRHGSFFAVIGAERPIPAGWRKLMTNRLYALYEMPL